MQGAMPRQPKPTDLTINLKSANESAHTSSGPNSSPINVDLSSFGGDIGGGGQITSLPPLPASPPTSPRHYRDPSKGFLGNFKTRMTPDQVQHMRSQKRQVKEEDDTYGPNSSSMSKIYHLRKNPGSTPELSLVGGAENVGKPGGDGKCLRAVIHVTMDERVAAQMVKVGSDHPGICMSCMVTWPKFTSRRLTSKVELDLHERHRPQKGESEHTPRAAKHLRHCNTR